MPTFVSNRQRHGWGAGLAGRAGFCVALCLVLAGCGPSAGPSGPPVFYPPLPQRPRIQFLRELRTSDDIVPPPRGFRAFIFGEDSERVVHRIIRPYGMAMSGHKLYVCDTGGRQVVEFDFEKRTVHPLGTEGMYALRSPINICVGPGGELYVTDTKHGAVHVFGSDGELLRRITAPDAGMKPADAVWHDGELFVADVKGCRVLVFDPQTGRLLREFGKPGKGPGQFHMPTNLAFGPEGHLYVSDTMNARVQKMDRKGRVLKVIGELGMLVGKMVRPKGIALDRAGRLYVADAAPQSVQIYDPGGASMRGSPELTIDEAKRTIARDSGSWVEDGFEAGQVIRVLGSSSNDGLVKIDAGSDAVTPKVLTFAKGTKLTPEGPTKVIAVTLEPRLLLMLGGSGPDPGDMTLPAKVIISYDGVEHFERYAMPDFKIEYLILVSNQFSPKKVNVYGFGTYTGRVPGEQDAGPGAADVPRDSVTREGRLRTAPAGEREKKAGAPSTRSSEKK